MQLFMFTSSVNPDLRGFAAEPSGAKLPEKFGPWDATGVVRDGAAPPHRLPRSAIEEGIRRQGYQLWRKKAE